MSNRKRVDLCGFYGVNIGAEWEPPSWESIASPAKKPAPKASGTTPQVLDANGKLVRLPAVAGKTYVRAPQQDEGALAGWQGWILVPTAWLSGGKSTSWTTAINPRTGKTEWQHQPPVGGSRGTHYGQPVYPDSAYSTPMYTRAPMPWDDPGQSRESYAPRPNAPSWGASARRAAPAAAASQCAAVGDAWQFLALLVTILAVYAIVWTIARWSERGANHARP